MSKKSQELAKDIVERVRACAVIADVEFDGIQTSFTELPQLIYQTTRDGRVFSLPFDPNNLDEALLQDSIQKQIAAFRQERKMSDKKVSLYEKLYNIYLAIDMIEKRGENTSQRYFYIKAADVTRTLRQQLVDQRIYAEINFEFVGSPFTIARAKEKDAPFTAVVVRCSIVFHDLDSSDTCTASGLGTGADTGDKAAYKAQTGALKYALKNAGLIPDEADPEADYTVDEASARNTEPEFRETSRVPPSVPRAERKPKDAPILEDNPFDSPAAATAIQTATPVQTATTVEDAPENVPGKGDAYEEPEVDGAMPTPEQFEAFRQRFTDFTNNVTSKGKLVASGPKLKASTKSRKFLENVTGVSAPVEITIAGWEDFFSRVDKKAAVEGGWLEIAKMVNKVNGIEEKK